MQKAGHALPARIPGQAPRTGVRERAEPGSCPLISPMLRCRVVRQAAARHNAATGLLREARVISFVCE